MYMHGPGPRFKPPFLSLNLTPGAYLTLCLSFLTRGVGSEYTYYQVMQASTTALRGAEGTVPAPTRAVAS